MGKLDEGEAKKIRFLERIESAFLNLNIVLRGKGARKEKFSLARNCEIEGGAAAREESKEKGKGSKVGGGQKPVVKPVSAALEYRDSPLFSRDRSNIGNCRFVFSGLRESEENPWDTDAYEGSKDGRVKQMDGGGKLEREERMIGMATGH